ncbi:hypothetical protein F4827_002921 [Paraburkholderia bannensis]|uniref:Uncharacterized protein n=1 Tax=Paraburkholderia bannensis TaxID=765414 RepID=A0A7W9TX65_9BURK|nr:hypothetical protein [Paraburkholderia bannensis]MBB3258055.1 hypothetical protein [Paraburkholderia sp. WP4_3_2]MBB6103068.1 hypothetical protein [Paraburkholderia bannensis]
MNRLAKLWLLFRGWHHFLQRAVIAFALYLMWLASAWIYSEGFHGAAELLGTVSSFGCFFAVGGWYILRGAFFILVCWLRAS